jgi:hypothetical protein
VDFGQRQKEAKMTKTLLVLIVLLFVSIPAFSQSIDTAWVRRYNGPNDSLDWAHAIAVDGSNNVYVTGLSWGSGTYDDYTTIKYYPNGDTAWVRRYNGPGNYYDDADAIAVDGSNNVYVTGYSWGSGTFYDIATIKYYPNGNIAWVRRYNGPDNGYDVAQAIAVDASNNVYVTGYSWGSGTRDDYTTIKYYPNGDTAWVRRYNGPGNYDDYPSAIAVDGSNNVYVTGETRSSGTSSDYATIKYYPNGDTAWVRSYNGTGDTMDVANSIALDSYGNVYVSGYSYASTTSFDYVTVKYDSSGTELWVKRYDGPVNGWDEARALATDGSGNVCVTGVSVGSGYNEDYLTIKYYPNGDTAWVRRHNGPGHYADQAYALAVDGSGNVYVTGFSGVGLSYDYATIKYYPDGDIAWVRTYDGQGNGTDYAQDMAVDVSGNVYVTGGSYGVGTDYDYATIKYIYRYLTDTLAVVAYSPVDLIVTDPKGDSIGIGFNTIPGATYDTMQDLNSDGDKDDLVTLPNRLAGDYKVRVVAESEDTGHYDLGIRIDGGDMVYVVKNATCPPPGSVDTFYYNVPWYMRGDANADWKIRLDDVILLANYVLKGGASPHPLEAADVNCDGKYDLVDVILLARYVLLGEPFPC